MTLGDYNAVMDHIGANLDHTKRNIEIVGADLVSLHGELSRLYRRLVGLSQAASAGSSLAA
jgi:hypothetical protein